MNVRGKRKIGRRFLAVALSVCMLFAAQPGLWDGVMVQAAGKVENDTDSEIMTADDSGQHADHAGWQPLTDNTPLTDGKYYLSSDKTMGTITVKGNVTLCLNGKTLAHDDTDGSVIVVESGTFTLCDCQDHWGHTSSFEKDTKTYTCGVTGTGGCITGSSDNNFKGGGVYVSSGATFNMDSGRITGCDVGTVASYGGGGVAVIGGTFNMSGGYVDGNKATSGGGVYLTDQATFKMSGNAVIMNNEGNNGGGVYCLNGKQVTFTMDSGAIIGNKIGVNGGGVFLGATSTFNMNGGMIEGNCTTSTLSSNPAGIYVLNATINLAGDCLIRYNKASVGIGGIGAFLTSTISVSGNICIADNYGNGDGTESNVSLSNLPITVTGELTNDIGVTYKLMNNNPVSYPVKVVIGTGSYPISDADWSHFSSDNEKYEIQKKKTDTGNELWLALPGSCDLSGLTLSTKDVELKPDFQENETTYTATVGNDVKSIGITATLKNTPAEGEKQPLTMKINNGTENTIESGKEQTVNLVEGKNTIAVTVTSGGMSKTYTLYITREAPAGFKVTLDGNGGSVDPSSITVLSGGKYEGLPTPERNGYIFDGWYTSKSGGTEVTSETTVTVTSDQTLYAQWTPKSYSIKYNLDSGTVSGNPTSYTIESNDIILTNPTKEGYTFSGWSGTGLDENTMTVTIPKGSTGNRTYTAHWTAAGYKVTLEGKGKMYPLSRTFF